MKLTTFRIFICCAAILAFSFISLSFAQEDVPIPIIEPEEYDDSESDVEINSSDQVVRLIYLVPNDRLAQPDIDAKLDVLIKKAQTLYADAMAAHGFGKKTFRFETDANGKAIVHHVNGLHDDVYYQTNPSNKITQELRETFDFSQNVYFITVEISSDTFDSGAACGYGGDYGLGGRVFVPGSGSCFEGAPLAEMTQLRALNMPNNQITDITPLSRMTQLVELSLGSNQIKNITPLASLTQLQRLYLSQNQISDVSALSGLVNTKEIYLRRNPIKNKKPLLALLRNNPGVKIYLDSEEPLPVKLSSFKAVHTAAGAVLSWTTESELDNAGFNILRSSIQTGDFKQVNTKLIAGAGTTGIRTEYTWTDTTAKPNTVYYYRIVDVSHAGEREHLATVRLRGLVSATGKLITAWANMKGSR